jgi:mannan endo-1,4-beta-mannosidase
MVDSPRFLVCAALFACFLSSASCVRQPGAPVAARAEPGRPPTDEDEGPIEDADRPVATFLLDGEPLCFAGTNSYYPIFKSHRMVDDLLEKTKSLGLKVIRIWGYLDRGSLDGTVGNVDGPGEKGGVYFQYWDPVERRPRYNDGVNGIEHLDYVLDKARQNDVKVIVVLTNNWKDFGGMDQYVTWYGLKEHHQFYTNPSIAGAFKDWIAHLVNRTNTVNGTLYKDDPTIFGWELANEPRCRNDGGFADRSACSPETIVTWADATSSFVKSIDPNHLVSVGDEGFFANGGGFGYDGSEGVDHTALLAIHGVDFGTYHLYPDTWGTSLTWASKFIQDHIEVARNAGKPTVLEEYGVMARRNDAGAIVEATRRNKAYPRWHELIERRGGNAALFWMLAAYDDEHGRYPDYDHFALYADDPIAISISTFAARMETDSQACRLYRRLSLPSVAARRPFVSVSPPPSGARAENGASTLPPARGGHPG